MYNFSKLFLAISLCLATSSYAQQRLEVGGLVGGSFYQGDILGQSVNEIAPNVHGTASFQAGYFLNNHLGFRFSGGYGKMSGGDNFSEFTWRQQRNLSFHSNVYNAGVRAEYNLIAYNPDQGKYFTLYPFLGYQHVFLIQKRSTRARNTVCSPWVPRGKGYPSTQT